VRCSFSYVGPVGNRLKVEELHSGRVMHYTYVVIRFSDDDVVRFEPEVSPDSSTTYPFEMTGTKVRFSPADGTIPNMRQVRLFPGVS